MRYDTKLYFVRETGLEEYDNDTGDLIESEPIKTSRWVNVADMGEERMQAIFGRLKQGSVTIKMQGSYNEPFDYLEIGGKAYDVALTKRTRTITIYEAGDRA